MNGDLHRTVSSPISDQERPRLEWIAPRPSRSITPPSTCRLMCGGQVPTAFENDAVHEAAGDDLVVFIASLP